MRNINKNNNKRRWLKDLWKIKRSFSLTLIHSYAEYSLVSLAWWHAQPKGQKHKPVQVSIPKLSIFFLNWQDPVLQTRNRHELLLFPLSSIFLGLIGACMLPPLQGGSWLVCQHLSVMFPSGRCLPNVEAPDVCQDSIVNLVKISLSHKNSKYRDQEKCQLTLL